MNLKVDDHGQQDQRQVVRPVASPGNTLHIPTVSQATLQEETLVK